jgi:tRNA-Thr(GGU) m(6)t(6)A37 methyltransferase TsaA
MDSPDVQKLKRLLPHWLGHNSQHVLDHEKWASRAEAAGLTGVAREIRKAVELSKEANRHIERAGRLVEEEHPVKPAKEGGGKPKKTGAGEGRPDGIQAEYPLKPIGVIHTPYMDSAPYQPLADDEGEFRISVDPAYAEGLRDLDRFSYIYVIYVVHRVTRKASMSVSPYWAPGVEVGVFASRSPVRPNRLGLSIVRLERVEGNQVYTSGLDVFDGTPLLDIKPYMKDLDSKSDANLGWLEDIDDKEHLMLHIKGIPHDY